MKVLVIHGLRFDSRLTTFQHTLAFARHLNGFEVTYVNGQGLIDENLLGQSFDLAVITYELLALRNTPFWMFIEKRISELICTAKVRVVMPQDDYSSSSKLDAFIVDNNIQHVFSPLTRDLSMIYPRSISAGVQFSEAFTGYWETKTEVPYLQFRKSFNQRSIDVGQRVRYLPPQLGPAAQKKGELAIKFGEAAKIEGFSCDISTNDSDVLLGLDWWRFLGDIKFTVGRLGGASIVDSEGHLARKVNQLQLRNPRISFDAIAKKLKIEKLEEGDFAAVSPRLFECAAMGVCQVLERDTYFEDFLPWTHYLPLDSDLGNLSEVFTAMRDGDLCSEIARRAEESLIGSGRYSYFEFVKRLVKTTLNVDLTPHTPPVLHDYDQVLFQNSDRFNIEKKKRSVRHTVIWNRRPQSFKCDELESCWLNAFTSKHLIVESLTIPWCSALTHMGDS